MVIDVNIHKSDRYINNLLAQAAAESVRETEVGLAFREVARKANMSKFLDALNGICVEYLGCPNDMFPIEEQDIKLRDRVLDNILNNNDESYLPEKKSTIIKMIKYGLYKTSRLLENRWKYRIVYNESLLESFFTLAMNRLKH